MNLAQRDQQVIWHPLTQHQISPLPIAIERGEGARLFDYEGNSYLDLVSSWWVNIHGHGQPQIAKAIYDQALQLEHVIFANFTHEPAVRLAEELLAILPAEFSKVYYSDNGSTSVEIALKMAYQYWCNRGEKKRNRFVSFENGYHGDTFGAMAVGKTSFYATHFTDLLFEVDFLSFPATWLDDVDVAEKEQQALAHLEKYLSRHAHETAGLIIEPLVQGASGMHMCRPKFLQQLVTRVKQAGIIVIFDEVMTGFGRTGNYFACQKAQVVPDIICLSKGISGGFLPIAATICQEYIYQAFLGDDSSKGLAHSHSYTANPLGCAASLASLQLLTEPQVQAKLERIEKIHHDNLVSLADYSWVQHRRYCGTIGAFDLNITASYGSQLSIKLRDFFLQKGLLIRPLGNVVYLMPPYCIDEADLQSAYTIIKEVIENIVDGVAV